MLSHLPPTALPASAALTSHQPPLLSLHTPLLLHTTLFPLLTHSPTPPPPPLPSPLAIAPCVGRGGPRAVRQQPAEGAGHAHLPAAPPAPRAAAAARAPHVLRRPGVRRQEQPRHQRVAGLRDAAPGVQRPSAAEGECHGGRRPSTHTTQRAQRFMRAQDLNCSLRTQRAQRLRPGGG